MYGRLPKEITEKGFGIRGAYIEASMAGKERISKDENRGAY